MEAKRFKQALVTGASSGIGGAVCRLLASKGIPLILSGRNKERLQALADALDVPCQVVVADLSDKGQLQQLIDCLHEQAPDLVVNNAGFGLYGKAIEHSTEEQLNILEVNGNAVLTLTLEAAKMMQGCHQEGTILNVSSAGAFQSFPYFAVYAASKALVNAFSEALDAELRPIGIRVLAACPGMVSTAFGMRAAKGKSRPKRSPFLVMTPEYVAQQIWWQIQKGKTIHIFNWKYRLATFLTRYILPKKLIQNSLARTLNQKL